MNNLGFKFALIVVAAVLAALLLYPPSQKLRRGIDLSGGTILVYEINRDAQTDEEPENRSNVSDDQTDPEASGRLDTYTVDELVNAIKRRIDPDGVKNIIVRRLGQTNRIEIILPGEESDEVELIKDKLTQQGSLNFRILATTLSTSETRMDQARQQSSLLENPPSGYGWTNLGEFVAGANASLFRNQLVSSAAEDATTSLVDPYFDWDLADGATVELRGTDLSGKAVTVGGLTIREGPASSQLSRTYRLGGSPEALRQLNGIARLESYTVNGLRGQNGSRSEVRENEIRVRQVVQPSRRTEIDDPNQDFLSGSLGGRKITLRGYQGSSPDIVTIEAQVRDNDRDTIVLTEQVELDEIVSYQINYVPSDYDPTNPQIRGEYAIQDVVLNRGGGSLQIAYKIFIVIDRFNVTGNELESVRRGTDPKNGAPIVEFSFNPQGTRDFGRLTRKYQPTEANETYQLGIILDDLLISAPSIESEIRQRGNISGGSEGFEENEVRLLVDVLRSGNLPASLESTPLLEDKIGPTLGTDTINKGLQAIFISTLIVPVFMIFYYRFAGLIAVTALGLNLLLLVGTMAQLKAAFTLPGMAGIALTIGMAVDANVLIFERIREEREKGAGPAQQVRNGFDRAWTTILDANVTTVLAGVVLYAIGTDEVRGFAVTLVVGLIWNLFTAVFASRVFFDFLLSRRLIKQVGMLKLLDKTDIDFVSYRGPAALLSVLLILVGMGSVAYRVTAGGGLLNIDFTGGTLISIRLDDDAPEIAELSDAQRTEYVRRTASQAGLPDVTVESINRETLIDLSEQPETAAPEGEGASDAPVPADSASGLIRFNIRTSDENASRYEDEEGTFQDGVQERIQRAFGDTLDRLIMTVETVQEDPDGDYDRQFPLTFSVPQTDRDLARISESFREILERPLAVVRVSDFQDNEEGWELQGDRIGLSDQIRDASLVLLIDDRDPTANEPDTSDDAEATSDSGSDPTRDGIRQAIRGLHRARSGQPDLEIVLTRDGDDLKPNDGGNPYPSRPTSRYDFNLPVESNNQATDVTLRTNLEVDEARARLAALQVQLREDPDYLFERLTKFGGAVAGETRNAALVAIIVSWITIIAYLALRFRSAAYGLAAILAVVHDILITLGIVSLSAVLYVIPGLSQILLLDPFKIDLPMTAAFLTLIGFSVNDTIVIFDRIREIKGKSPNLTSAMINQAINQTLSRTIITSVTTLLTALILYVFGGEGLHGFSFCLVVGVITGTYSTIFIACPTLLRLAGTESKPIDVGV